MNTIEELRRGLTSAFIDGSVCSNVEYNPQFISNNYKEGKKVLSSIESELLGCDRYCISVAFITQGGITPLLQTLKELDSRGIDGKILTTDYLMFSDPKALNTLASLEHVQLRMYMTSNNEGFHTKGYIFQRDEMYRMIIGSSNMTMSALTVNKEWNSKIVSTQHGEYAQAILAEFDSLWNSKQTFEFSEFYDSYSQRYLAFKAQQRLAKKMDVVSTPSYTLEPNSMQSTFINNLRSIYESGKDRALLVSATGTGKTYASAFAMRALKFKRVLFVVHRNQIAKQAMNSFHKVFNGMISMGLVSGEFREYDADYIFTTVQTMSKEDVLSQFSPSHFDAIIIDEAHHSSADSYKKLMNYFTPKLWLGMTATPDKRDDHMDGQNIYEIFDHQIACEIRLQDAMEEDLLCPFHYFGITDLQLEDGQNMVSNFRYLTCDERVDHIIQQAKYFGFSGDRVKGLIFCSRIEEARQLSKQFNERGFRTVCLSGSDSQEVRARAVERLAGEECENALDYIFSVDIFSEGVDVPEINQVIMLRPTESPIVFIQQLGRGLRKAIDKEFVVVLDFIGNYNNNFMIPIALSGDRTYNKDNIRRYMTEGSRIIPGSSSIHFDEISRKRIYQSIDHANFSDVKLIKQNYINLKNKLGHIPALLDFDKYGEMDVLRIFDNKNLGSYYKFLVKYDKEYTVRLSKDEEKVVEFLSKKLASGKRRVELDILQEMLEVKQDVLHSLEGLDVNCRENVVNILSNEFPTGSNKNTYAQCIFLQKDSFGYRISKSFSKMLENPEFYAIVKELVDFGLARFELNYSHVYSNTNLVLYQKYTYEDVCRLLNWEKSEVPLNIGGYKFDKKTKTFPVFINYDKSDSISDTTKYEDHFVSSNRLIAISKSGRSLLSEDVQNFLHAKERGIDVHLFVRKNKDDKISKEFYYLGRMEASGQVEEIVMANTDKTAVEIEWLLDTPVREDLYEYIVNA